ncbi:Retrovirus-related Pol polyprotein from transposon RE2 [Vitis vinifera]|uniref:Retrovirus-related Pol polyprotein from transposon RE2 n=1 Tax=Vitis vinifera TaxID=29760 RepID=A0A438CEC4_VITVI|nr:Retrovirus-related Pol polyprotein from transposon RE2 [Vitis vinifera]
MQTTSEPHTYNQASKSEPWVQAMQHEYQALLHNHTWSLVPPPPSAHIFGCCWIYKLKYLLNGSVERHKARLVAQGFTQTLGLDYFDTFSPVVKPCTILLILALAVSFQWPIRQLDVENAFLNGDLQEESSRPDTSLFIHHTVSDILILLVYMDDILITGSNPKLVSHFISYLHDKFALRDLGPLSYFLGIQAQQQGSVLHINQQKYITDLLHRTQMEAAKPTPTPYSLGPTLSQSDGVPLPDPSKYRRIVGALQYVTFTRPDIAFSVNKACQFMAKPSYVHWDIVMLTRPPVRMIAGAPADIVSSSAQISSHGPPPNNA